MSCGGIWPFADSRNSILNCSDDAALLYRGSAVQRFGPYSGTAWKSYVEWSKLGQIEDLVTLDNALCPTVLPEIADTYWPHIVNEDFLLNFFTDLPFLRDELASAAVVNPRIMCVFRNPAVLPTLPPDLSSFHFYGFDLIETPSCTSALTNCGGWPELDKAELSKWGLLPEHRRALQLQYDLRKAHPDEPHADCDGCLGDLRRELATAIGDFLPVHSQFAGYISSSP